MKYKEIDLNEECLFDILYEMEEKAVLIVGNEELSLMYMRVLADDGWVYLRYIGGDAILNQQGSVRNIYHALHEIYCMLDCVVFNTRILKNGRIKKYPSLPEDGIRCVVYSGDFSDSGELDVSEIDNKFREMLEEDLKAGTFGVNVKALGFYRMDRILIKDKGRGTIVDIKNNGNTCTIIMDESESVVELNTGEIKKGLLSAPPVDSVEEVMRILNTVDIFQVISVGDEVFYKVSDDERVGFISKRVGKFYSDRAVAAELFNSLTEKNSIYIEKDELTNDELDKLLSIAKNTQEKVNNRGDID